MRQFRTYGSVRGAEGNLRPYRDPWFPSGSGFPPVDVHCDRKTIPEQGMAGHFASSKSSNTQERSKKGSVGP